MLSRTLVHRTLDGDGWPGSADAFASRLRQPGHRTNDWPIKRDSAFRLAPRRACLRNRFTGVKSLSDKRAALVDMGKHLGMFKELHEHSGRDGGPIKIEDRPMSDIEAARRVAFALGRALQRQKAEKQ